MEQRAEPSQESAEMGGLTKMEGQKLLSLNRETLTIIGISLVPWLATLIAIVAMLNSFNSNINRGIDRLDASIKANGEALAATNAVIAAVAANGDAIAANGAALDSLLAQATANGAEPSPSAGG